MSAPLTLTVGPDHIAELRFAAPGDGGPPTLTRATLDAARRAIDECARLAGLRAVLVTSAGATTFLAGADLREMRALLDAPDAGARVAELAAEGQAVLFALERLAPPTIAVIAGAALGGGLEVALACRHRVAVDRPGTVLGLPEVQLGLVPGLGGTQRLPRLLGLAPALDVILKGRRDIGARQALRLGLVDACVPAEDPLHAARAFLARLEGGWRRAGTTPPRPAPSRPSGPAAARPARRATPPRPG